MKKPVYVLSVLSLIIVLAGVLLVAKLPVSRDTSSAAAVIPASATPSPSPIAINPTLAPISSPTAAAREQLLSEIRSLAAEYGRAIQAEKQSGAFDASQDPNTGEEIFRFSGASNEKVSKLYEQFIQQFIALNQQYLHLYKAEVQPTPFPTQPTAGQNEAYYNALLEKYKDFYDLEAKNGDTLPVYNPDEGKTYSMLIGDSYARSEILTQAFEALRVAPLMAEINQAADLAQIRQVTGKPDMQLTFMNVQNIANAPHRGAAVYGDQDGVKYWMDIKSGRLAMIEPTSHADYPITGAKSMDELRKIAGQFALANSARLADLKADLLYEEGGKGGITFFRWDYRTKDWSGTDWAMMPPLVQVGLLADGRVFTYLNTLDLLEQ
jgi:hypothetical protein